MPNYLSKNKNPADLSTCWVAKTKKPKQENPLRVVSDGYDYPPRSPRGALLK
jgi:hypothetical protein